MTLQAPRLTWTRRRLPAVRPHRLGDPVMTALVALVVYALHGYDGALNLDLGVFIYGGLHVAQGTPPYIGVFNSVGPLADVVPGLAMWLGHLIGVDPILSARLFFTALSALCCSLVCVLARDTLGSRTAGFLAPAVFLTFEEFLQLASDGPREKTTMVVFLIACQILLGRRRWALAGACAALATLTWQPAFLVALGGVAAATLIGHQDRRRGILLRFTIGGLVPSVATVGYFVWVGALSEAIDGFFLVNVKYTRQPSALTSPNWTWAIEWSAYHWSLLLILGGLAALLLLGARSLASARGPTASPMARRMVSCAVGALVGTVWTLLVVNGGPDLFMLLPYAALGVAGATVRLLGRLPHRLALFGAVGVVSLGVVVAGVESVTTRDEGLRLERADVSAVLATEPPDATVVSLSAPQVLALAGRDSPVPYQIMITTQERYLDATYPGGMDGFLATLIAARPTFVVVGHSFLESWPNRWLERDFRRVGGGAGWVWYLSRSAGHEALIRARIAHEEVMAAHR